MRRLLLYTAAALLALYALTGVVQVRRGERAVIRRFGRVLDFQPEPGLHVGLPWGMDRVQRIETDSVRSVSVGYRDTAEDDGSMPPGQLLTGDHNLVNVQAVVYYRVDGGGVVDFALSGDRVGVVLGKLAESAIASWVATQTVDEVLLRGKMQLREQLLTALAEPLREYKLGVEVTDVRVSQVSPPEEVREAFDGVSRAQTQILTSRNKAEQEASAKRRQAEADANRVVQSARAEVSAKVTLAAQEAGRFRERWAKYDVARRANPKYLEQLWREERGRIFAKMRDEGRIDLLDHHLMQGGLDLISPPRVTGTKGGS